MSWKNLSPTTKGVIIGGIIGAIIGMPMIFVIIGIGLSHDCYSSALCPLSLWENLISAISGAWLGNILNGILPSFMQGILLALIPIHYFVYGAIIGWIIGKIKSKK